MVQWAQVSSSGYYDWLHRKLCKRAVENTALLNEIRQIHEASHHTYGSKRITIMLNRGRKEPINHKRVERIMHENGIFAKTKRKYKATTYSDHDLPVAPNVLNRDFLADQPGKKMVSDITYVWTDEGWLYVAGILDLCGRKMVGLSMDKRMTKDLVIAALDDAANHTTTCQGCILHSDRGSQYCSLLYQKKIQEYNMVCSMSRKGNCWDNAPMESFWGTMKQDWLNGKHFRTRAEAKASVFEYVWIFYNRQRIHSSNGYLTPEEYYKSHSQERLIM